MSLSDIRKEIKYSQEKLAQEANVSMSTIYSAERGRRVIRLVATSIVRVLNRERAKRELDPITVDDIEWEIRG